MALAIAVLLIGAAAFVAFGDRVTNLGRKTTDSSAEHSVYQRASFVYVSMRMFQRRPGLRLRLRPILRHENALPRRPEPTNRAGIAPPARPPQHPTEHPNRNRHRGVRTVYQPVGRMGVGCVAAGASAGVASWQRAQGLFALATIITYLSSALFHDLTLSATDHWLLFLTAGVTVGLMAGKLRGSLSVDRNFRPSRRLAEHRLQRLANSNWRLSRRMT